MRGEKKQEPLFSYRPMSKRVPLDHPLRPIRRMVDEVLTGMSAKFEKLYSHTGRPSIPPEELLRALLIQILFTVRSERQLMEQLDYNLLFRWFVGLPSDEDVWSATTFSKNRDRLLEGDIAREFFTRVLGLARDANLLSDEHFTVDGTLIEAWAGHKSFKKKGSKPVDRDNDPGNPTVDFHGEKRSNETHQSTTDRDSRLYKKSRGTESKLAYLGHVLMDNRHGLATDVHVTKANGRGERKAALKMLKRLRHRARRRTLGADRGYDVRQFVEDVRGLGVTPHVAQVTHRRSGVDGRTTRHAGYEFSLRCRKRVEEIFGWMKTVGLMRKTRHRGKEHVDWMFTFTAAAYNLVRIRNIQLEAT